MNHITVALICLAVTAVCWTLARKVEKEIQAQRDKQEEWMTEVFLRHKGRD